MPRPFRQVDVFGSGPCTGNPVAVVLDADGLSTEDMQRVSDWTNLSEATFVLPPSTPAADYRVRIFSLRNELPFAGHPTLGTARAWLDAGGRPATDGTVVQECGIGLVEVRLDGERLSFAAPPRIRSGEVDVALVAEVLAVLGVEAGSVLATEWLDNGPGWIGVLLDDVAALRSIDPDLGGRAGAWDIGVIAPTPDDPTTSFALRAFFTDGTGPLREDPVTGSLNAAAAHWLLSSGRATAPYVAQQGAALGRSGRVHVAADDHDIWIGGRADVVVTGEVELG